MIYFPYPMLTNLKEYIDETIKKCLEEFRLDGQPKLESSWFSIMRKHTYHEEHHSMFCVWSGVYYVQADQTHPGLTFANRNQKTHWPRTGVKELTESNSPEVTCVAQTGSIIIFPAICYIRTINKLLHKERIMVSFNYGI